MSEPSETALTAAGVAGAAFRWGVRWAAVGFVVGAVGGFCIPIPYNDFLVQTVAKGVLGGVVGGLLGLAGGSLDSLSRRKARPAAWAVAGLLVAVSASGVAGLFWAFAALARPA